MSLQLSYYNYTKKRTLESIIFSFLKPYKIFKKTPFNDYIWVAERGEICTPYF